MLLHSCETRVSSLETKVSTREARVPHLARMLRECLQFWFPWIWRIPSVRLCSVLCFSFLSIHLSSSISQLKYPWLKLCFVLLVDCFQLLRSKMNYAADSWRTCLEIPSSSLLFTLTSAANAAISFHQVWCWDENAFLPMDKRKKRKKLDEPKAEHGEITRLPPILPGLDLLTCRHMWTEFVSFLLSSETFFPGYSDFPLSTKNQLLIWFHILLWFSLICSLLNS